MSERRKTEGIRQDRRTHTSADLDSRRTDWAVVEDGLVTSTTTQTQGHPDSPGPYTSTETVIEGVRVVGTGPVGSYAAGSQRAAAESASLQGKPGHQQSIWDAMAEETARLNNGRYPGTDDVRYTHTEGITALLASILVELKGLRSDCAGMSGYLDRSKP